MKKILSISLLLSMLFLYGCSTNNKLFENRQKCMNIKNEIEQELKTRNSSGSNYSLEQLFYGPVKQQCFIVTFWNSEFNKVKNLYEYGNFSKTSESLDNCFLNSYYAGCEEFEKKIQELKGE